MQATAVATVSASILEKSVEGPGSAVPESAPAHSESCNLLVSVLTPTPANEIEGHDEELPEAPAAASHEVTDEPAIALGMYLVSVQPRSRFKRLHRMGDCAYRPRAGFQDL